MSCYCIGPQNGEPLCPCMMDKVKIIDGRYVYINDLGPAPIKSGTGGRPTDFHQYNMKNDELYGDI